MGRKTKGQAMQEREQQPEPAELPQVCHCSWLYWVLYSGKLPRALHNAHLLHTLME